MPPPHLSVLKSRPRERPARPGTAREIQSYIQAARKSIEAVGDERAARRYFRAGPQFWGAVEVEPTLTESSRPKCPLHDAPAAPLPAVAATSSGTERCERLTACWAVDHGEAERGL